MKKNYVTLFDSNYLPQGLSLHISMERHLKEYTLWVLCVDKTTYNVLHALELKNVRLIKLEDCETDELKRVKPFRSNGEYCWTLTPFAPRFVFEHDSSIEEVTYIDADCWFRKQPDKIFDDFNKSGKSLLITDHAYDPNFDQSNTSGQYCVQFMIFARDESERVRKWWEEKCIDWCYSVPDAGRFGDQKYLDVWPSIFKDYVHVLADKELILAPWNAQRFPYGNCCVWHFHGARLVGKKGKFKMTRGWLPIPRLTWKNVYLNYFEDIKNAITKLENVGFKIKPQSKLSVKEVIFSYLRLFYYKIYNLRSQGACKL